MKKHATIKTTALALALACICAIGFGSHAIADSISLSIGDTNELGFVEYGIPSGDQDRTNYVNYLIGMSLGSTAKAQGQTFTRSNNAFSPLDAVTDTATTLTDSPGNPPTTITLAAGDEYLLAKYDGPNYGSEVWYVGGLTSISIPEYALPGGVDQLSGWTLFVGDAPPPPSSVPDGGATVLLLGMAITGLGVVRRRFSGN